MLGQGAAIAPALNLSTAGKRKLLEVDLAGSDPALAGIDKRVRADGFGEAEGFDDEEEGIRHMGGRGEPWGVWYFARYHKHGKSPNT